MRVQRDPVGQTAQILGEDLRGTPGLRKVMEYGDIHRGPRDASSSAASLRGVAGKDAEAAVVIVNFRTAELVVSLLRSIEPELGSVPLDLVVVDNGSGDGSVQRIHAARPEARIVQLPENRGFAAGVNAGFAATEAPIVLVLNPDVEVMSGAVRALVDHLRECPRAGVAAPLLLHPDGSLQRNGYRRMPNLLTLFVDFCIPVAYALEHVPWLHPHVLPAERLRRGGEVAHAYGAALAIRRDAYRDAGPFDEGFFLYLEETEWQGRVRARGWTIELVPSARMTHLVRGGGEAAQTFSPHYVRSAYRYFGLRGRAPGVVDAVFLAASLLSRAGLTAIAMVPGKGARARRQRGAFAELAEIVRVRRRSGALP
jgi:N-acetylglucosaminyl-diphospho-decaprenol L-rhamnosyltransferase